MTLSEPVVEPPELSQEALALPSESKESDMTNAQCFFRDTASVSENDTVVTERVALGYSPSAGAPGPGRHWSWGGTGPGAALVLGRHWRRGASHPIFHDSMARMMT